MNIDRMVDLEYLGLTEADVDGYKTDPLQWFVPGEDPAKSVLRILRNPRNFALTCKHVFGMEVAPFQLVILETLWEYAFPMLIGSRGASKSTLLGLYCLLRATFVQGSRIVVTGMGFRQSKQVLGYAEGVWHKAPVLQSLFADDPKAGPSHGTDRWTIKLGDSLITGLPMGDGSSIRGERANVVIGDEFASISREIFETVVAGFGVVSLNPIVQMRNKARIKVMRQLKAWTDEMAEDERRTNVANQLLIAGTAYYSFNHFATYWKRWKQIIESRGDERMLREAFIGDAPEKLDWRDYAVVRLPVELVPDGFMDQAQVARSKATIHSGTYLNEFAACLHPETKILTDYGVKSISDVVVGDRVLTHKGRFRPVLEVMTRPSSGEIIEYKTLGYSTPCRVTKEHPFWTGGDGWVPLQELTTQTHLSNLVELSGRRTVDIREIDRKYRIGRPGLIYATWPKSKYSNELLEELQRYDGNLSEFARSKGMRPTTVIQLKRHNEKPKKSEIPAVIDLDYDFGLIVGYYASEGSIGAGGRLVDFALDGHTSAPLEAYVDQLADAIQRVFGHKAKRYDKGDNTTVVAITNRLVASLMKFTCPGLAGTKSVNPDVLWSNPEFLRGFLVGYWNGDGHLTEIENNRAASKSASTSYSLSAQVRMALSYFGISSTLQVRPPGTVMIRGRRHQTSEAYIVVLSGENETKLYNLLLGKELTTQHPRQAILNTGDRTVLPIVSKETIPYDGIVYNLEVAEDHSYSILNATVHNCFASDSNGFFKRSTIEACVTKEPIQPFNTLELVKFTATLRGDPALAHVMAVDPASENDNFSIVILELHPTYRKVVYCWTTNRQQYKQRLNDRQTEEGDYYHFCARKIRDLMTAFNCVAVCLDAQGGGIAVLEALGDKAKLKDGEAPLLPVTEDSPLHDGKKKESDDKPGRHIVELVQFSNAAYVSEANHGLRKDLEDKALLFPYCDPAILAMAAVQDDVFRAGTVYDTLEDAVMEIEDLKDELGTITHTQTPGTLRDHWDTPELKMPGGKKGRLRKDRYSALLMANYAARRLTRVDPDPVMVPYGGFLEHLQSGIEAEAESASIAHGPDWWSRELGDNFDHYGCI